MDKKFVQRLFPLNCKLLYDCFKYLFKKKSFLSTPNVKNKCSMNFGSIGEMKLIMKFYWSAGVSTISLNFEIYYFLSFPWEIVFAVINQATIYMYIFVYWPKSCSSCISVVFTLWPIKMRDFKMDVIKW